jgi:YD repeat-containing protein
LTTPPEAEVWERCEGPPVRKRATERAAFSDNDEVLTLTDALGHRIAKRYDRHGRVTEIVGPDDVVQETRIYDDAYEPLIIRDDVLGPLIDFRGNNQLPDKPPFRSRSVQTLDGMGNSYTVWIDALDRSYRQKAPDGTESLMEFDDRGREWRRTTPTAEIVTMTYDWLDRPITLTVDSGAATATETRAYDLRGNLLRAVDADGEVRLRTFDVMNRLLSETVGDPAKRTPLTIANNTYDEHGRVDETILNGVRTAFRYDDAGRLVRKLVGYDPDVRTTALMREDLSYTARDELESSTDKRGEGARSSFDELGRVVARETLYNGEVINRNESGYDLMGRVIRIADEQGDVT